MNKVLAKKLLAMAWEDQQMRKVAVKTGKWGKLVDKKNAKNLKKIIEQYGWPTIPLVGKRASRAAWLVAQHADHDPRFQKRCLSLIKEVSKNNPEAIDKMHIAYLTDRVRMHEGKKQLFGTQFIFDTIGALKPYPIQDRRNLNKRRKEYELDAFESYEEVTRRVQHK